MSEGATGGVGCCLHVATVRQQRAAIMSTGYSLTAVPPTHGETERRTARPGVYVREYNGLEIATTNPTDRSPRSPHQPPTETPTPCRISMIADDRFP